MKIQSFRPLSIFRVLAIGSGIGVFSACSNTLISTSDAEAKLTTCSNLQQLSISSERFELPTSGAVIETSTLVQDNENGDYCSVTGFILPQRAEDSKMEFRVNLPTIWNKRALQMGGGGPNGSLITGVGPYKQQTIGTPTPLKQGYVTLGGDGGYKLANKANMSFGLNEQNLKNYARESIKRVHDAALPIIKAHYGETPGQFYFVGKSNGGREALTAASLYPNDYDGVIAIAPAQNYTLLGLHMNKLGQWIYANNGEGRLNDTKRKLLFNAVYAACDSLDNLEDGIISNTRACNKAFNIATVKRQLRCLDGMDTGDECLSDAQIDVIDKLTSPHDFGFSMAGEQVYPPLPLLEGSEMMIGNRFSFFGGSPDPGIAPSFPFVLGSSFAKYFVAQGENINPLTFTPDDYRDRLQYLASIYDLSNISLERFYKRGGKILLLSGAIDANVSPHSTIRYFDAQSEMLGRSTVDEFLRMYIVPGFDHSYGRYNLGFQGLEVLVDWVENGKAPNVLHSEDNNMAPGERRSRPLCPWPTYPHFNGVAGEENLAKGFTCTAPRI